VTSYKAKILKPKIPDIKANIRIPFLTKRLKELEQKSHQYLFNEEKSNMQGLTEVERKVSAVITTLRVRRSDIYCSFNSSGEATKSAAQFPSRIQSA